MLSRSTVASGILAIALPVAASAATVGPNSGEFVNAPGTNTYSGFFVDGKISDLGDINIANADISVNGGVTGSDPVNAGVAFDVYSDPVIPRVEGAAQLLFTISSTDFSVVSGSFDGEPLNFDTVATGSQAIFETKFSGPTDTARFFLEFEGAEAPDNVQISLAPVAPIPLPAGVLLMGTALGGFGLFKRYRKG